MENRRKIEKVICIKNFDYIPYETSQSVQSYYENSIYHLIEYTEDDNFYSNFYVYDEKFVNKNKGTYPTYALPLNFRKYFVTPKEYRKLKLKKLDGTI